MRRNTLTTLIALTAAAMIAGCSGMSDRPAGDEVVAAGPAPAPAPAPIPALVEPENYDEGLYWSPDFPANPFWWWGQVSEQSGYPYTGIRIGCDLLYFPSINYCKYFDHPERLTRIDRVFETDAQGFTDDWDLFWLNDRPTYLTRWYQR